MHSDQSSHEGADTAGTSLRPPCPRRAGLLQLPCPVERSSAEGLIRSLPRSPSGVSAPPSLQNNPPDAYRTAQGAPQPPPCGDKQSLPPALPSHLRFSETLCRRPSGLVSSAGP